MFGAFPVFFLIVFIFMIFLMIFTTVKLASEKRYNDKQPVLMVDATVVSKRTQTETYTRTDVNGFVTHHDNMFYYVTFQVESGDRMELKMRGEEYGFLSEGDRGRLTFQGTRFLGFEREYY